VIKNLNFSGRDLTPRAVAKFPASVELLNIGSIGDDASAVIIAIMQQCPKLQQLGLDGPSLEDM